MDESDAFLPYNSSSNRHFQLLVAKLRENPKRSLLFVLVGMFLLLVFVLIICILTATGQAPPNELIVIFSPDDPTVQVYSTKDNQLKPLTRTWPRPRKYGGVVMFHDKIYLIGGTTKSDKQPSDFVDIFDPADGSWTEGPTMTSKRSSKVPVVVNNKILVCGCWLDHNNCQRNCEVLDEPGGTWRTIEHPGCIKKGAGAVVGKKAYILGGVCTHEELDMHIYDAEQDKWSLGTPMAFGRFAHSMVAVGQKIYVCGGVNLSDGSVVIASCDIYDTAAATWHTGPELLGQRRNAPMMLIDGVLYVVGGSNTQYQAIDHIDKCPVPGGNWVKTGTTMQSIDDEHCALASPRYDTLWTKDH